jgi:hypothetical protein
MKINLKKIQNFEDYEYIRKLRNTSYVKFNSLNKQTISKNEHKNWIKKNKLNKFFVLKKSKKNIGYIRIDEKNFVSWALEKNSWGKIKFSEYLKKATNNNQVKYSCLILFDNIRSQIVALKAGFKIYNIKKK